MLTVNPFDIQEQAETIHRALTMSPRERRERADGLREEIFSRNPRDWIDEQVADINIVRQQLADEDSG